MNALSALNKMVSLSAIFSAISMCCAPATSAAQLEWISEPGGRSAPVRISGSAAKPVLELIEPAASGIRFTNHLPTERHLTNQILLNGSGVTAGDVDGDGWCDLFFAGLGGGGRMFRNLGGWRFEDITTRLGSRLSGLEQSGVALVDLDGDGDLDLVVNSVGGGTHWLSNDGKGNFTPTGEAWNVRRGGSSVAFGDMDGDGDLDAYIANYRIVTIRDQPNTRFSLRTIEGRQQVVSVDGVPISDPELANRFNFRIAQQGGRGSFAYDENGEPDVLLRNDRAGRWTPVAFTAGSFLNEDGRPLPAPLFDWGLSVAFRDINQDGAPDIYVCNDFRSPDRLWINNGRGVFRAAQPLTLRQISLSSMGVDFADVNRDGWDDFLVVDMLSPVHARRFTQRIDIKPEVLPVGAIENRPQYPRNTFFLNRGDGTYAEAAQWAGLDATEWSWTPVFVDVDLDGYEDLLVSNGFERDGMNMDAVRQIESVKRERKMETVEQLHLRRMFPRLDTANMAFRNLGNGAFTNLSAAWGFNLRGVSHGMCLADLDNDGDLDCVVNNLNAPASVYRNNAVGDRIAVRLRGKSPNTRGIGARIQVTGGPVAQSQEMMAGGRYLSCDDSMRTFAAGREPMRIEVTWRSGRRSVVENAKANRIYEVDEASSVEQSTAKAAPVVTHFTDVSGLVNHRHVDEAFDDFALQPTLSKRLSQSGPGVAWFDVDGDGWDDLLIGCGRGGTLAAFRNDARGGFVPMTGAPFEGAVSQDQTTVLGLRTAGGERVILVGSANYENGLTNEPAVRVYRVPAKMVEAAVPGEVSSSGPMAMADVDGDGELDLFVGGRVIHGKLAVEASSQLYRQRQGKFVVDPTANEVVTNVGLVSGAVFSDLDADGDADLVLACEWGPLKIFRNDGGKLVSLDPAIGFGNSERSAVNVHRSVLSKLTGWWNGVTTGDFDGDGRMDIAASNWGRNTRAEMFRALPLRLFHGEASGDGSIQAIEAYTDPVSNRLLPMQPFHVMGAAVPAMRERMASYENYAKATLPEIYGETWKTLHELNATTLDSMIFLNRGDHFEARSLPVEAQLAPAFAVCAGDLNGDGFEDLFLSQNFFAVHPEHSRLDGGRGLWLRGDGRGGFAAVAGQASGLLIYGEQRGAALSDFDADGRVDLVVAQNAAATKLFQNKAARPGLRIRLQSSAGNPSAVGAVLRVVSGGRSGPAREIHSGSGYWSQDSAVQVIAMPAGPAELSIRWPGGKVTTSLVPPGAKEISIDATGKVAVMR